MRTALTGRPRQARHRRRCRTLRLLLWALVIIALMPSEATAQPGTYRWPISPTPTVVRGFDPPEQRWLAGHRGVDLSAAPGTTIHSAGPGTVNFAGVVAGKPVVSVLHPDGIITTYEPVAASVRRGQVVAAGVVLGTVVDGHPGCASGCLHWGARRGSGSAATYLNPLALLGAVQVRLKPVGQIPPDG